MLRSEALSSTPATHLYRLLIDVRDVPAMGYKVLRVIPGREKFESDLQVHGTTIENAFLWLSVDPSTGCITSLMKRRPVLRL